MYLCINLTEHLKQTSKFCDGVRTTVLKDTTQLCSLDIK